MPNANGLALRPPMRCLRLGGTPQTSAPAALQAVDPVENAGGPLTSRGCEPLAMAAKHRGRLGVGHEQAGELALVIALDELDASCARDDAQFLELTVVAVPSNRCYANARICSQRRGEVIA